MPLTVVNTINPIKVTGDTSADTEIYGNPIGIKYIYWFNPTTIGHLLTLKDSKGLDIVALRCEVANESQLFPLYLWFDDLHCDDMDSGTLYIYIK